MFSNELWQKSGVSTYSIDQSIRFNNNDTAYMKRTPSSSGNQRTWTLSMWVKRGELGNYGLFGTRTGNTTNFFIIEFNSDDLFVQGYASSSQTLRFETTAHFRDPSAWYHLVFVADTTNAVPTERIRIYVNGERVTSFASSTYPTQNYDTHINSSSYENAIGCHDTGSDRVFSGYMTDIVMLDGTAADPSSFGEYNSSNIWIPKDVSGLTFGTNGFHIDGRDSSDLGDDESGQGNDYTVSGLAAHDQVFDSPTNNFCVMNSLNTHSSITLSNGNLQSTASAFTGSGASILLPSTGKWYAEFRYNNASTGEYPMLGVYNPTKTRLPTTAVNPGVTSGNKEIGFGADGRRFENGTNTSSWGNSVGDNKIGALAIDMTNKKIWFGHNNSGSFVWQASGDPSAGSNEANTIAFDDDLVFGNSHYSGSIICWNFGQEGTFGGTETAQNNTDANGVGNFYYTVPTGYLALCTKNIGA
tara:strand:+ start:20420 stop:21832 length:1413 start_codon:yes stop_codon:yes gene_type:complete